MSFARFPQRWWYRRQNAWWLALLSFAVVLLAAWSVHRLAWQADEARLAGYSRDLITLLSQRMRGHEQILRGGAGLFDASDHVSRDDWRQYVKQLRLPERFPGIQGVGYAERVRAEQRAAHETRIRAEGFPAYRIRPEGERAVLSAIIYLEPFSDRNLAAFGFDMLSEPTRNAAMLAAMRTGDATLTARVTLVQETHGAVQPGFLMYVPVYQRSAAVTSEAEREAALTGWVYSPFRAHDLVEEMLRESPTSVHFALYDGDNTDDPYALLYHSQPHASNDWQQRAHHAVHHLPEFGRTWTLVTWLDDDISSDSTVLISVLIGLGSVISLLLFLLLYALAKREERATQIAADMTENLRHSEAALAASAQQARAIIDHVVDAILTLASDGRILQANPAAERLFGYPPNGLSGCNVQQLIPTVPAEQLQALLRDARQTSGTTTVPLRELEARRADNASVAIEMTLSVVANSEHETFVAVCRDISERRRVDRLKREFVATVSHELRTPLTSITGSLDLVLSGQMATLPAPVHDLLSIAQRNGKRLAELINDLLDIEQLSRGQLTVFLEPLSLPEKLPPILSVLTPYADAHHVSLQLPAMEPDLVVLADRKRLQQVLTNLLSNAIKFSPSGGTVTLTTERHGDRVRILVTDQGPGVPKEFEPRLFEQFSRADSTDHRRVGGTGLGLAISKELIERMQGRIGYRALQPQGACFYVELPSATAAT